MTQQHITLITGASRGIGFSTAEYLAKKGHLVIGLARHNPEKTFPGEFFTVDLSDRDATTETLANLTKQYAFDGVVNNVGIMQAQLLEELKLDNFEAVIDLNLRVAIQTVQAVLPSMKAKKWGRIVNLSSIAALGVPGRTSYTITKAGMIGLARTWALELVTSGITVNTVAPGLIETEGSRRVWPPGSEFEQQSISGIAMRRFGQPSEVAATIGFLFSEEAGYITGQTLFVDGGCSIDIHPYYKAR
ncbi:MULTISPECIES: SDR family oxidoreductase [unclassified Okeania]|uniref:SDR family oxidoreductase n=1 Tax=unclassified Okeania TaxID=2634635 RepID=UPI0013BB7054|nr:MULTISPECIES: SDR family oxidoreductase [unclassified Okeania]NES76229.1 SDR family oxidoreductase [Okeania sp. SIO1H4]NET19671.1 SDR family oxidoreductase [Okeania sp. SIO1H5]NET93597.1 SDR family oxidoreductase [Okeania sp. SIO1H2]